MCTLTKGSIKRKRNSSKYSILPLHELYLQFCGCCVGESSYHSVFMHVWRFSASCMSPTGLGVRGATGGCHGFTGCKFVNEAPSIYGAGGVVKTRGT